MTERYAPGGITVTIGKSQVVQLPPKTLRGRCTCMHFDTDKAFLLPMSIPGIRNLNRFYQRNPGLTVLVNGHTDLVGDPAYNRTLSDERATSVAAYLQDRVDDWLAWYSAATPSKRWGTTEDQQMLRTLTDASGAPYYAGEVTGTADAATSDAIRRWQTDRGLTVDGVTGPETRRALIEAYMQLEGTTLPASATLVIHGCGEAHPVDATAEADQGNRRVEIFLFDGPVDPAPTQPCPLSGCAEYPIWIEQTVEEVDLCAPEQYDVAVIVEDDRKPQHPIPGAQVSISAPGVQPILVGDDGIGTFANVPAGDWELTATHADYPTTTRPITVPTGAVAAAPPSGTTSALAEAPGEGPAAKGGTPGGSGAPTPIVMPTLKLDLVVDWGAPSLAVMNSLGSTNGVSFWLTDTNAAGGPVALAELPAGADTGAWTTAAPTTTFAVPAPGASATKVKVTLATKKGALIRLDFVLKATIGSSTRTTLKLQQLFEVVDPGAFSPVACAIDAYTLAAGAGSGQPAPTRSAAPERRFKGAHPLLAINTAAPQTVTIDCQFVDCTELWWDTHAAGDTFRWYLEPQLGGRVTHLRVLAWTIGAKPMIWFAIIPDGALDSLAPTGATPAANIVYLKPPAAPANSFVYSHTKKGFSDAQHQSLTMFILARYLLTPSDQALLPALAAAGVKQVARVAAQLQPSGPGPTPRDPISLTKFVDGAFFPCGLEAAVNAVKQANLLLLPLGHDAGSATDPGGYNGIYKRTGLRASVQRAVDLLWNVGAAAATSGPVDHAKRQLWMAAHSGGNGIMWQALRKIGAEIDRVISISATGSGNDIRTNGIDALNAAAAARSGKSFEAVVITAPDLKSHARSTTPPVDYDGLVVADLTSDPAHKLSSSVTARLIPDLGIEPTYWRVSPVAAMNPFMANLLANWNVSAPAGGGKTVNLIDDAARTPANWFFLFFHEYAAHGGHRDASGTVRLFFEDAIGALASGTMRIETRAKRMKPSTDSDVLPNAPFTVTGPRVRKGVTDAAGRADISDLDPGEYEVRIHMKLLKDTPTKVTVGVGTNAIVQVVTSSFEE